MSAIEIEDKVIDPIEADEVMNLIKSWGAESNLGYYLFRVMSSLANPGTKATTFFEESTNQT